MPPRAPSKQLLAAVRQTRVGKVVPRAQRRNASDSHGSHESAHHDSAHHGEANETFGRGFFIALAGIPFSYAVYKFSRSSGSDKPFFTRMIEQYSDWRETWIQRNDIHVRMMEQAARDSNLFMNSKGSPYVDLKFPENFNVGSPYNVPAGSQVDLSKVIEKYRKEAFEENERKHQQLKDGTLRAEQPAVKSPYPVPKNPPNP